MHLGRAYVFFRRHGTAERPLHDGIAKLRSTDNRNFLVQALRHLAALHAQVGRRAEAIKVLREAQALAGKDETQGQLQQIEEELRGLGEDV